MPAYPCFLLEPTDLVEIYLRRFTYHARQVCGPRWGHHARTLIETRVMPLEEERRVEPFAYPCFYAGDGRWPGLCKECGYTFEPSDEWQVFTERIWRRVDGQGEMTLRDLPTGAMYRAWWLEPAYRGPDGHCYAVKTPGGIWIIDSRASNCTLPTDDVHRCWIRHGTPPHLTVDKDGVTCSAGAGSIQCGPYHGYLRNGALVDG